MKPARKKLYDPDKTKGTRSARKTREKLNRVSREERERLLCLGMAMIYGKSYKSGIKAAIHETASDLYDCRTD